MLGADDYFAFVSSVFATLSFAYPFQTAIYSESLFSFLATSGMLAFYQKRRILAAILFGMAGLTRSNGILLPGFFIYDTWASLTQRRRLRVYNSTLIMIKAQFVVWRNFAEYHRFDHFIGWIYCISILWIYCLLPPRGISSMVQGPIA